MYTTSICNGTTRLILVFAPCCSQISNNVFDGLDTLLRSFVAQKQDIVMSPFTDTNSLK